MLGGGREAHRGWLLRSRSDVFDTYDGVNVGPAQRRLSAFVTGGCTSSCQEQVPHHLRPGAAHAPRPDRTHYRNRMPKERGRLAGAERRKKQRLGTRGRPHSAEAAQRFRLPQLRPGASHVPQRNRTQWRNRTPKERYGILSAGRRKEQGIGARGRLHFAKATEAPPVAYWAAGRLLFLLFLCYLFSGC